MTRRSRRASDMACERDASTARTSRASTTPDARPTTRAAIGVEGSPLVAFDCESVSIIVVCDMRPDEEPVLVARRSRRAACSLTTASDSRRIAFIEFMFQRRIDVGEVARVVPDGGVSFERNVTRVPVSRVEIASLIFFGFIDDCSSTVPSIDSAPFDTGVVTVLIFGSFASIACALCGVSASAAACVGGEELLEFEPLLLLRL